jgi:putative peptidoglycan lipid II flippase
MTLALWPAIRRSGFRFRWNPDLRNPAVREVGRMSGWTLGYVLANQAALFVVLLLANRQEGGPSTYAAALIFFQLPHAVVAVSLMTAIVPGLASANARGDRAQYREQFSLGIRLMALIILPAATGYVVLGGPIAHVLRFGAVTMAQADLIGDNLVMFGVGLFGYSVYLYTLRGFYALRDTRTPFFLNLFENGVNIAAAFALEPVLGVPGLALAYAIAYTTAGAAALIALRRRVGRLDGTRTVRSLAPIVLACVLMAGCVAASVRLVGDSDLGRTAVGVVVGAVVFGCAILVLRVEEVDTLRSRFRRRA